MEARALVASVTAFFYCILFGLGDQDLELYILGVPGIRDGDAALAENVLKFADTVVVCADFQENAVVFCDDAAAGQTFLDGF